MWDPLRDRSGIHTDVNLADKTQLVFELTRLSLYESIEVLSEARYRFNLTSNIYIYVINEVAIQIEDVFGSFAKKGARRTRSQVLQAINNLTLCIILI